MITTNDRARKLEEITDEHKLEVAKIFYPIEENWSSSMHTPNEVNDFVKSFNDPEDIPIFGLNYPLQKVIKALDFLRQFYDIPNEYQQQVDWDEAIGFAQAKTRYKGLGYVVAYLKQNFHLIKKNNETTTG